MRPTKPLAGTLALLATLSLNVGCATKPVRFATFNASLNRSAAGKLVHDLSTPNDAQARKVAEIVQRTRPDVLLVNEFDFDADERGITLFQQNYLGVAQSPGLQPIRYEHALVVPSNTGVPSSLDLNNDGQTVLEPGSRGYGDDCWGYGEFPGQYAFVILSRFPIDRDRVRTHQELRWSQLPGSRMPTTFYSPRAIELMRLSSKNHVDVPIDVNGKVVHVLAAHPTPPIFDGPEDRNGLRNHDEIALLRAMVDKLTNVASAPGAPSPVERAEDMPRVSDERFVILGDMNADPLDGETVDHAIRQLLDDPRVDASVVPRSPGAAEAAGKQGGPNATHATPPETDTADFPERNRNGQPPSGNLRVDYVLPSKGSIQPVGAGVFWPPESDPLHWLIDCSDHRLVWMDVKVK